MTSLFPAICRKTIILSDFTEWLQDPSVFSDLRDLYDTESRSRLFKPCQLFKPYRYRIDCIMFVINRKEKKLIVFRFGPKLLTDRRNE